MPIASRKNLDWDKAQGRGYMSGKDVTWTGEDVNDHIEKWMKDMGMFESENEIPKSGRLDECLVVGGTIGTNFVLAKNRDRKVPPTVSIVRKLSKNGTEMVLMYDKRTRYVEGMNQHGIGILNATLLNEEDSRSRSGYNHRQGNIIHRALCCSSLQEAIGILCTHSGGIEGHTIVSDPLRMFHIELMHGKQAKVSQLDPTTGWDARTNHGIHFAEAGYMPRDGKIYMSSNYRKTMAEIELNGVENEQDVMKVMRQQHNEPDSHMNMHRRVPNDAEEHPGFITTSQIVMNLTDLHFLFHCYNDYCDFKEDIEDLTPEGHEPKIKITISKSDD